MKTLIAPRRKHKHIAHHGKQSWRQQLRGVSKQLAAWRRRANIAGAGSGRSSGGAGAGSEMKRKWRCHAEKMKKISLKINKLSI
jgi:hypothetical protein